MPLRPHAARLALAALLGGTPAALLPGAARAQTADTNGIWTLQIENDAASTLRGTSDQYYTSGLRAGWTSGADALAPIARLGHWIWADPGVTRLSLEVSQSLFTPRDTQAYIPPPNDRPYAGVLIATAGLVHDLGNTRDYLAVSGGVLGPSALGKPTQNGFHDAIGDTPNRGWDTQIADTPVVQILGEKLWRVGLGTAGPIEFDAVPSFTAAAGSWRDYAQGGTLVRLGQGLNADFGPSRIQPGLNGTDAYTQTRPFVWYVFGGLDGQAVAFDATLDGATFRDPARGVRRTWYVGEMEAGAAVMWHGVRLSYTQTWQTEEFHGQKGGLFNFGSLALSAKF
jgi:lipid A 3-O-deacylase